MHSSCDNDASSRSLHKPEVNKDAVESNQTRCLEYRVSLRWDIGRNICFRDELTLLIKLISMLLHIREQIADFCAFLHFRETNINEMKPRWKIVFFFFVLQLILWIFYIFLHYLCIKQNFFSFKFSTNAVYSGVLG